MQTFDDFKKFYIWEPIHDEIRRFLEEKNRYLESNKTISRVPMLMAYDCVYNSLKTECRIGRITKSAHKEIIELLNKGL